MALGADKTNLVAERFDIMRAEFVPAEGTPQGREPDDGAGASVGGGWF
jgi:hypothetical protein